MVRAANGVAARPRILADANVALARETFTQLGDVRLFDGRGPAKADVRSADILLVRSTIHVDERLLGGSNVKFVGTATSGIEHVDREYLQSQGIVFADAHGSNARSVAEYVVAALIAVTRRTRSSLVGRSAGIIGVGAAGSLVDAMLRAIGMTTVLCDPPRARVEGDAGFQPLGAALACDVVTAHVPLTHSGAEATRGLLSARVLSQLRPGAIVVNTSRGGIADEPALRAWRATPQAGGLILDVLAGEPEFDPSTVAAADIATAHVAGHSFDGKLRGTVMLLHALSRFLGDVAVMEPRVADEDGDPLVASDGPTDWAVAPLVLSAVPVLYDDAALRAMAALPVGDRGRAFDAYRRDYPPRREFAAFEVRCDRSIAGTIEQLGFRVR
jgi:erythronate-4-phosphate dehydrogenase